MGIPNWNNEPGLNHVGAYQVSGRPFAKGGIDATSSPPVKVEFPTVTRWITIINNDTSNVCKVGFSALGIAGDNYFTVHAKAAAGQSCSVRLEVKVSEIWLSTSEDVDIVAGLTGVPVGRASTSLGTSFSGSSGVGQKMAVVRHKRKLANVSVKVNKNEHVDKAIRRFIRKCKKEGIVQACKERRYFKKPSQLKHERNNRKLRENEKENKKRAERDKKAENYKFRPRRRYNRNNQNNRKNYRGPNRNGGNNRGPNRNNNQRPHNQNRKPHNKGNKNEQRKPVHNATKR